MSSKMAFLVYYSYYSEFNNQRLRFLLQLTAILRLSGCIYFGALRRDRHILKVIQLVWIPALSFYVLKQYIDFGFKLYLSHLYATLSVLSWAVAYVLCQDRHVSILLYGASLGEMMLVIPRYSLVSGRI